ncbi:Protein VTS1 [Termitomyces sp. T112]|nr:Protein VTS1 [Termitomyces sp. T112]
MSTSVEFPKAAPTSAAELAPAPLPNGGEGAAHTLQGLDLWLQNFRKYEATLQDMTKTSTETKFKTELGTIERWFKILSEAERTATVYTLMLHSNQDQIRFFISALQQMIRPDVAKPEIPAIDITMKSKDRRPPSLNIPEPGSPTTPTPVTAKETPVEADADHSKAGIFKPISEQEDKEASANTQGLPGLGVLSPFHLNMLANAGLSPEAQLLAVQLIMSGVVQPVGTAPASQRPSTAKKPVHPGDARSWRTPNSTKYPKSALQSGGLRTSALKSATLKGAGLTSANLPSAGLKSSGLDSAGAATPREEDFDPEMLNDVPAWLRSLRLHKYTSCFDGLTWQEMVVLDDATLEAKGVAALGARRRLLRTFEHARKKMGMEDPDSATPTTSALFDDITSSTTSTEPTLRNAASSSKLSITSPIFVPSSVRGPQSAAPRVSVTNSSPNAAS